MEEERVYYTNNIGIEASVFDVKFHIGYITMKDNENINKELCEIVMSPEHAKAFEKILSETIQRYEKLNSKETEKEE